MTFLVTASGSALIAISPVALERLIAAVVVPMALLLVRNRPSDVGQFVDGAQACGEKPRPEWGMTRGEAMRHPYFWVLSAAVATSGFFGTAIGFHQIALLGERGLSATEAAANFLPQAIAGTAATLLLGYLVDRANPRLLLALSMVFSALAIAWGTMVAPGWSAIGFGMAIGAGGNALRAVEGGMTPKLFGTKHIGALRGAVGAVTVGATAFAPLLYSLFFSWTGSRLIPS